MLIRNRRIDIGILVEMLQKMNFLVWQTGTYFFPFLTNLLEIQQECVCIVLRDNVIKMYQY